MFCLCPCSAFVSPRSGDLRKVVPDGLLGIFHSCMGYYKCVSEMIRPLRVTHYKGFFKNVRIGVIGVFRMHSALHPTQIDKTIKTNPSTWSPSTLAVWNTTSYFFVSPKARISRRVLIGHSSALGSSLKSGRRPMALYFPSRCVSRISL